MTPSENHRAVAQRFQDLIDGTSDWDAPTPVAEWVARDVVGHLLGWFPPFLQAATGTELTPETADADPSGAWSRRTAEIQAVLDSHSPPAFHHPRIGAMPTDQAIDRFYTADVFMHSWDLARATGQDDTLDEATCETMLAGMQSVEDLMRSSGQYGPKVDVPANARAQDRLIGFIGRDPNWRPH